VTLLVTGASGFVGSALCAALSAADIPFRRALRELPEDPAHRAENDVSVGRYGADTDWTRALEGVSGVIHLAARTHVMREEASDPVAAYREVNVQGTLGLARSAAAAGVRHFLFLSSIKVNGERTGRRAFTASDPPAPEDAYGMTKWQAEQALAGIAAENGMGLTVLRPPLVYGPGVKGNFLALMQAVYRGLPMPLASIDNRRSLIYVDNLVSAILACVENRSRETRTFLVSDGEDVSTPELVRRIGVALGREARLFPMPVGVLRVAGRLSGRGAQTDRLCDSLQVDSAAISAALGWMPPFSVARGLEASARWFRAIQSRS
jgi:nucleoside-diphosphate-sugar epimerase